jgi:hypothetical protein
MSVAASPALAMSICRGWLCVNSPQWARLSKTSFGAPSGVSLSRDVGPSGENVLPELSLQSPVTMIL